MEKDAEKVEKGRRRTFDNRRGGGNLRRREEGFLKMGEGIQKGRTEEESSLVEGKKRNLRRKRWWKKYSERETLFTRL